MLKFIWEVGGQTGLSNEEQQKFASFVQAQMSTYELFAVFYNAFRFPKQKKLVIAFCLFEHLPRIMLLDPNHDVELYGQRLCLANEETEPQ